MAAYVFLAESVIPIPDVENDAFWRFWAEMISLLAVIGFTIIFLAGR